MLLLIAFQILAPWYPPGGGGGLLPYMGYIGMCGLKGYGFQPFWT